VRTYQVILVDDERSALELLKRKVETLFPHLMVVGSYQDPRKAISYVKTNHIDIMFLDIEMPHLNGFEMLAQLSEVSFQVIFVTAYNEYALPAIKQSAVDYILKPIDDTELNSAVQKAVEAIEKELQVESTEKLVSLLRDTMKRTHKLIVPTAKGLSLIPESEVLHLEGYEGYTRIHLVDGSTVLSSYSLGRFDRDDSKMFFKCHKSHIVNLEHVRAFENEGYLLLEKDLRVPISRTHRKAFLKLFHED
jgi:two-component system LytT family response regulator